MPWSLFYSTSFACLQCKAHNTEDQWFNQWLAMLSPPLMPASPQRGLSPLHRMAPLLESNRGAFQRLQWLCMFGWCPSSRRLSHRNFIELLLAAKKLYAFTMVSWSLSLPEQFAGPKPRSMCTLDKGSEGLKGLKRNLRDEGAVSSLGQGSL